MIGRDGGGDAAEEDRDQKKFKSKSYYGSSYEQDFR